mgnify:CR=1 FL=1
MKVLLVNSSPHEKGCVFTALDHLAQRLNTHGIETEIFSFGHTPVSGCIACGACRKTGKCFKNDLVNEFAAKCETADGFVFGTPVYYAHPSGRILSFLDRAFYSGSGAFRFKPGAAVAVARRGGTTASFDCLNKYFGISQMPVIGSTYWNNVHGAAPGEAAFDAEGLQTMRNLARNLAWMLKCFEAGKKSGISLPETEKGNRTNYIR